MKFVAVVLFVTTLIGSTANAQYTCAEDAECQQAKIEAMGRMTEQDLKSLKADVLALRSVFSTKADSAKGARDYGSSMRGVLMMDEYLARLGAYELDPTFEGREELRLIEADVKNLRQAYPN